MCTYFVYRSPYHGPSGKYLKRFDDATVLDWFRKHWRAVPDGPDSPADAYAEELLGTDVYGFDSLFMRIAERGLAAPANEKALWRQLRGNLYVEGEIRAAPHCVQVLTDDDELELAYYFFDDTFLAEHRDRASFLLNADWRLPGGHANAGHRPTVATTALAPRKGGPGATYLVFHGFSDSGNLDSLEGGYRFSGLRLPDLARHLSGSSPTGEDWPFELRLLRAQLLQPPDMARPQEKAFLQAIQANPGDATNWAVYSDWLQEQGRPRAGLAVLERALTACARYPVADILNTIDTRGLALGDLPAVRPECEELLARFAGRASHDPARSLVHVEGHLAQLCLHTGRWGRRDLFHQWFLFDDLWAGAHPALANTVLQYARRWDVLS
jgi:uncharacterized protein (TIGR02996 family)